MIKENNTICPAVWDHLCINNTGKNRLCCNAVTQDNDKFIENYYNHWNLLRENVKKEMIEGIRPEICKSCWQKEDLNITSLRNNFIIKYQQSGIWNNFLANMDKKRDYPLELDLKLGNYCNFSCRMCSSYSSSSYATEFKKIYKDTGIDYGIDSHEKKYIQDKWYLKKEFIDKIKEFIENGTRHLKFTGGEPLMVPSVKTIINFCIENNYAKEIDLIIITNVSLIDDYWLNIFLHFKFVNIICSIDGTNEVYEYIRHPAVWKDIKNNLVKLSKIKSNQILISVAFTLQIYNILDIQNMINLCRELDLEISSIALNEPSYLDVRNAPNTLKQEAIERIKRIKTTNKEIQFITDVSNKINQSFENLEQNIETFIKISALKDHYKNQNLKNLEIWKYYK